ncbi:MAG: isocitrate/isopropylmalate dehydrogenase family protein [Sulfolobaceae archaeon]|nr:isocitrate/isopropylmalate dehydrogenase family protein [Sulfolobaceae archaeon]
MKYKISVIEGDGIGPEVVGSALKVLSRVITKYNVDLEIVKTPAGDDAFKKFGEAVPESSWKEIKSSHAILKGPVGETAGEVVVKIRRGLDLFANIRPARNYPNVDSLKKNVDLIIVRENTEDVYIRAENEISEGVTVALRLITKKGSERIGRVAYEFAKQRRKKVTIVHKANVLTLTDGLFKNTIKELKASYPEVEVDEEYIDSAVMDLVRRPERFDVIVTTNLYGDILSDLAAYITGSIGLAPSGNIGEDKAMFEPVHGAAFDIAGKNIANPTAMLFCTGWMLQWLGEKYKDENARKAGISIENAVLTVLSKKDYLTEDLGGHTKTTEFTEAVLSLL